MAFSSGEHVAGETGDYGEVSVQLVYTGAYQCSINVDMLTRKMLQVGEIVLTKSKRVHFIAGTLKDGHFPDSRFPRTLSKTFQSEKNQIINHFSFIILSFAILMFLNLT